LKIDLDYVVPNYRDFKIGRYIFTKQKALFLERGYKKLIACARNSKHKKYLQRMGFDLDPTQSNPENSSCYHLMLDQSEDQVLDVN
ncbi:MAG: hypothetical protein JXB08_01240, partial [Bacilli bacterium]|nr:hypothetical protein [Bacilli bacterium]